MIKNYYIKLFGFQWKSFKLSFKFIDRDIINLFLSCLWSFQKESQFLIISALFRNCWKGVCGNNDMEEGGRQIRQWTNHCLFRSTGSLQFLFRTTRILLGTPQLCSTHSNILSTVFFFINLPTAQIILLNYLEGG